MQWRWDTYYLLSLSTRNVVTIKVETITKYILSLRIISVEYRNYFIILLSIWTQCRLTKNKLNFKKKIEGPLSRFSYISYVILLNLNFHTHQMVVEPFDRKLDRIFDWIG